MGTTKRSLKPKAVASVADGDLFPRGRAEGSVAKVRKRDGTVLFGGDASTARSVPGPGKKRARPSAAVAAGLVSKNGLSAKRMAIGMSAVGVVTAVAEGRVELGLGGGVRGACDGWEVLVEGGGGGRMRLSRPAGGDVDVVENSEDEEEEEEEDAPQPLWKVVKVGHVVRVAVVAVEKGKSGTPKVVLSCRPSLINIAVGVMGGGSVAGAQAAAVLRKGELMWGAVKAVEDHGYVVDFGGSVPTVGFLKFEDTDAGVDGDRMAAGTPVEVVVSEAARSGKKMRKVVRVTAVESVVNSAVSTSVEGMAVSSLRAGTRARARVTRIDDAGALEVTIFGLFTAVVERAHMLHDASVAVGETVDVRLLWVDAGSKRVGATMLPSLVDRRAPRKIPTTWTVGHVIQKPVVVRVMAAFGVVLQQACSEKEGGDESNSVPLFAHVSRVSDERVDKLESVFHSGLELDSGARIISFSPLDGIVNVDLRASILARKALSAVEIVPGERYECKVVAHSAAGSLIVAVDGDEHIRGVVPSAHLSDTSISAKRLSSHQRFKIGVIVPCICLSVDKDRGKVVLTSKRSLINSVRPTLASYEQAADAVKAAAKASTGEDGSADLCIFDGTVATVTDHLGVLVVFPGDVRGMVSERELFAEKDDVKKAKSTSGSKRTRAQVEALFPTGKTVTARVLRVNVEDKRMSLSFVLQKRLAVARETLPSVLPAGLVVDGTISSVDEAMQSFIVRVRVPAGEDSTDGGSSSAKKDKKKKKSKSGSGTADTPGSQSASPTFVDCVLPFDHLSDFPEFSKRIAAKLVGSTSPGSSPVLVEGALVLTDASGDRPPVISQKASLLNAHEAGALPSSAESIFGIYEADQAAIGDEADDDSSSTSVVSRTVLRGYVKAALPSGVIVGFLGPVAGLARKSRISDDFIADPTKALSVNQSVCAVVESVDKENERFTLSLRLSDTGMAPVVEDTRVYFDQFAETTERFGCPAVEDDFPVGVVVDSIMDTSRPYGKVLNLTSPSGSKAFGVILEQGKQISKIVERKDTDTAPSAVPDDLISVAESESIASAALSTAKAFAPGLASSPSSKLRAQSARKTRRQAMAEKAAETEATTARVLDVDPFSGVVDVSLDPVVVESAGKRLISAKSDTDVEATVLLVKDEYVILSVPRGKKKTAIAFALLPSIRRQLRLHLRLGLVVQASVLSSEKSARRNLVAVDWVKTTSAISSVKNASVAKGMSEKKKERDAKRKPVAGTLTSDKLTLGMKVSGRVVASFPMQVNVSVAKGIVGRIHVSNNSLLSSEDLKRSSIGPLGAEVADEKCKLPVKKGATISDMTLLSFREPASAKDGKPTSLELAAGGRGEFAAPSKLHEKCVGFVKNAKFDDGGFISGLWLDISPSLTGYCPGVDAIFSSDMSKDDDVKAKFSVGAPVVCLVSSVKEAGDSTKLTVVASANGEAQSAGFMGRVVSVRPGDGIRVEIPWLARRDGEKDKRWGTVSMCDVADDYDEGATICATVKPGSLVRVCCLPSSKGDGDSVVQLSMRASVVGSAGRSAAVTDPVLDTTSLGKESVGKNIRGFVRAISKSGCFVSIGTFTVARILLSNLADDFTTEPEKKFPAGTLVSGKISFVDATDSSKVQMSLRKRKRQALKGEDAGQPSGKKAKKSASAADLVEGSIVKAIVKRIEKFGAIVELPAYGGASALLHKSEGDQDRVVTDPWAEWNIGQALTVVSLEAGADGKCRVGSKRCYFEAAGLDEDTVDELIETNSRKLSEGELPDTAVVEKTADSNEKAGDDDTAMEAVDGSASDTGEGKDGSVQFEKKKGSVVAKSTSAVDDEGMKASSSSSSLDGSDESDKSEDESEDESEADDEKTGATLPIGPGFDFEDGGDAGNAPGGADSGSDSAGGDSGSDADNDEADGGGSKKVRKSSREKREKKRAKEAAEREIRDRENVLATRPDTPETAEDFERLLMGKPNASEVWIRYMAFRVSLSQFEKARAIAERALETVALSEELERVNIWIAYINLEASCVGDSDKMSASELRNRAAAVFRVFDRACKRVTDVQDLHLQVAAALREPHPELSSEILQRALKTFKHSTDVWCSVGKSQFTSGKLEAGRQTLERALLSLEKKQHVQVIMKFAQFEYRYGSSERGRTVFSSLTANFPKRLDLWSVYLDMETSRYQAAVKEGDEEELTAAVSSVRLLFERCATLDFSTKKTKFIFKRWLNFETMTGDKDAQAIVRSKARSYVENKLVTAK